MDGMDERADATTTTRALLLVGAFLLLTLPARDLFGDRGVTAVLLVALVGVAVLAYGELTGRPVLWPLRRAAASQTEAVAAPDEWRSERWVRDAVERGLRSLEEWRLEQRDA